jgi:haloalkane dehalogenase
MNDPESSSQAVRVPEFVRTPDARFANLPDYPYEPRYTAVAGLRVHHAEAGPGVGEPVLMLHGEPTWSFLYRKMIPIVAAAGYRVLVPDLVGFGRSDKPTAIDAYSYARHVAWLAEWIEQRELRGITLVVQDWGSLIGLRLLGEQPERFARVVVANGFLPTGESRLPFAFKLWKAFARYSPLFPISAIVRAGCRQPVSREVRAGYDAPFPDGKYKAGARSFPRLVPTTPDDPGAVANREAWKRLRVWDRPFLTAFATGDPIFAGADRILQQQIPGAEGQPHTRIRGAGHFVQEDRGEELAELVVRFAVRNPVAGE